MSGERWTEVERNSEGVSVTLYETQSGEMRGPRVVDETWWTWDEFLGMDVAPDPEFPDGKKQMVLDD